MDKKLTFEIKNFRNIIDVTINIWPDKINFIVGDNMAVVAGIGRKYDK